MGGKLSPIIIIVLVAVIIAIGILLYTSFLKPTTNDIKQTENENTSGSSIIEEAKPVLTLEKEKVDEEYPSQIVITATAAENEENPIEQIILPDSTIIEGTTAEYTATENDVYTFTVVCADGTQEDFDIEVTEIAGISANNPYVPTGFTHVEETTVETGYTIEDEYGNKYIWIPVSDGIAERTTNLDSEFEETTTSSTALVNSIAKYYGFYIAKYEASKYEKDGEVTAASMEGKIPWTNVTYTEAANYSESSAKVFNYEDCSTALVSSNAWDETMAWIETTVEGFSSSMEYGNYSGSIYATGESVRDVFNNICDLCGNVREWTTEIYKPNLTDEDDDNVKYRVVRSGSATLNKTVSSRLGYKETSLDPYWGFRMVLYK